MLPPTINPDRKFSTVAASGKSKTDRNSLNPIQPADSASVSAASGKSKTDRNSLNPIQPADSASVSAASGKSKTDRNSLNPIQPSDSTSVPDESGTIVDLQQAVWDNNKSEVERLLKIPAVKKKHKCSKEIKIFSRISNFRYSSLQHR